MVIDPLTAAAIGTKLAGSLIGGFSAKKAAKKRRRREIADVEKQTRQLREDLFFETMFMKSRIRGATGGMGIRLESSSPQAVLENVQLKADMTNARISENKLSAIKSINEGYKARKTAADIKMITAVGEAAFSYADANVPSSSSPTNTRIGGGPGPSMDFYPEIRFQ